MNHDGTLSYDELKIGLNKVVLIELFQSNSGSDEDCYQQIMDQCDLDGDGKIDYLEFIQAAINHQALLNKDNIQSMFQLFDTNNDGSISMQELEQLFCDTPKHKKVLEEIMTEVDKDNDGVISFEEFNDAVTAMLRK